MADPIISFYESDNITVMNAGNPLAFGNIAQGQTKTPTDSEQYPFHVWNDKGGGGSATMTGVEIGMLDVTGGAVGEHITGKYYEMKSNGSSGCADDAQSDFTAVGGTGNKLALGDIPANACRKIYVRLAFPAGGTQGLNMAGTVTIWYNFTP
jgi:hypothetical protein